jgi:hypothetical protein
VPLVNQVMDALSGQGNKAAVARRLAALPLRSNLDPGSGNVFGEEDVLTLITALDQPGTALEYIERHVDDGYSTLDIAMVRAPVDPIRCDPRFRAAENRLHMTDVRAMHLCKTSPVVH